MHRARVKRFHLFSFGWYLFITKYEFSKIHNILLIINVIESAIFKAKIAFVIAYAEKSNPDALFSHVFLATTSSYDKKTLANNKTVTFTHSRRAWLITVQVHIVVILFIMSIRTRKKTTLSVHKNKKLGEKIRKITCVWCVIIQKIN